MLIYYCLFITGTVLLIIFIIIHQTHYEKSDWSRAFNEFTMACELDMINVISAADITFIMSSSTSAWLLSPLNCSPQKQNGCTFQLIFIRIFRYGFFYFNVYFIQTKVLLLYFEILKLSWLSLSESLSP